MARKSQKSVDGAVAEAQPAKLVTIEELFKRHNIPAWQQRGLMVEQRWAAGKSVTEGQFQVALRAFLASR